MLNHLFSAYRHANTPVHRAPLWAKWLVLAVLAVLPAVTQTWLVPAVLLVPVLLLGTLTGITAREWLLALGSLIWLLCAMGLYYIFSRTIDRGADVLLTLITLLFASKILLRSTPMTVIIDGFVRFCAPLAVLGLSPHRVGLAIALMIRSIPVIMDRWILMQTAAAARGLRVSPARLFTPLVITTVAYAQETGDALVARGLDTATGQGDPVQHHSPRS